MHHRIGVAVAMAMLTSCALAADKKADAKKASDPLRDRGRYVVTIGGCNDCHTPGYAMSGGKTPEKDWLVGDSLGWRGGWGTTYPANLRLYMQNLTEKEWVQKAKTLETRPPMPWFALHEMTESDLRAIYRYIRALGPAGSPAPAYVPPNQEPKPPFVLFPAPPK